jgi:hypothetical protein
MLVSENLTPIAGSLTTLQELFFRLLSGPYSLLAVYQTNFNAHFGKPLTNVRFSHGTAGASL